MRVRSITDNTCSTPAAATVILNPVIGAPTAPTVSVTVQPTCALPIATVVISSPAEGTGFEYSIDGGAYQTSATFMVSIEGIHSFTTRNSSDTTCNSSPTSVNVFGLICAVADTNSTPINGITGGDAGINIFDNDTLNGLPVNPADITLTSTPTAVLTVNNDGTVSVAPNTPAGTYTVDYTICENLNPANCDTTTVTITVGLPKLPIKIYNGLSPNDTLGQNDVFFIQGIEDYPNNTVEIYNRWGVLIYDAKGYNNDTVSFKGLSNGRVIVSDGDYLPDGTYYYVVKILNTDGSNVFEKAGYLYINRK